MTRVRALACACACALLACKSATPATQVMVLIDSESELRSQIASVDLEVKSGRGDESHWTTRLQRTVTPGKGKVAWPIELSLLPGESGARGNYSVRAVAKSAQGAALGQVRAISGYVAHRTLALVLRFDAACFARSTPCASDRTCSAGECLDSHVAADLLPPFERDANGKPVLVPFGTPELDGGVAPDAEASDTATGTTGAIDAAVLQSCGDTLCDELAGCTGSGASRQCAACPAGFVGDAASGCVPTLLDLAVTGGTLTPKLSADVTQYAIAVPLLSSHVTLTPSVPNGATLDIDGALLESDSWSTPALPLGERNVALRVDYPAHPGRRYALAVTRSGEQEAFLKAKQTVGDDWFGSALAISGDTLVVGAEYEDSGATGVNGNADDESVMDSGAAYVFERKNGVFELTAYLKADTAEAGALFGSGVAIDGDTILVGAEHASKRGAVYVFVRSGETWKKQAVLSIKTLAAESEFGRNLAIQGDTAVIGAPGDDTVNLDTGGAFVFTRSGSAGGTWTERARLIEPEPGPSDWMGSSVAIDGNTIVVGATGASIGDIGTGAAYVFEGSGSKYSCTATLPAETPQTLSFTADSVAIDGDTIVVGAWNRNNGRGEALVFERDASSDNGWKRTITLDARSANHTPIDDDNFGTRVAIHGDAILVGACAEDSGGAGVLSAASPETNPPKAVVDSGAAYLFTRDGAGKPWQPLAHLKAAHPGTAESFGCAVALSADSAVVGARDEKSDATLVNGDESRDGSPGSGAAYVFR